jgi:hypothetical protein
VLSRADRPPLAADRLETTHRAPTDQKAAAFDSYLSYAGRWRLEGGAVVHSVEVALAPNIVGTEQVRSARLEGGRLTLTYDVPGRDGSRTFHLEWTR